MAKKYLDKTGLNYFFGKIKALIPKKDNLTITENSNGQLQTVGVIDQNTTNTNKFWTGTLAEYNAITTKDENTFYTITDDDNNSDAIEAVYPVGSIYTSSVNSDPADILGIGSWELIKTYSGGELIAFGTAYAQAGETITANAHCSFADSKVGTKYSGGIVNYVPDILELTAGTFLVNPQNIVGLVEAFVSITGQGGSGIRGLWWHENGNDLPSGVYMRGNGYLASGPTDVNYGGNSNTYFYIVDGEESFFVNPTFSPYNGTFKPSISGTLSWLQVKCYAKAGATYVWKRVS